MMNAKPLLYDLFCGAGGSSHGYQLAGFRVIGVDIKSQPRYRGDDFIRMDALEFLRDYQNGHFEEAAAFAASPPCQAYSSLRRMPGTKQNHPQLIDPTRAALLLSGKPYVIENVCGSPLVNPIMLCGTMFGLGVGAGELRRHRLFESNVALKCTMKCDHRAGSRKRTVGVYGNHGGRHFTAGVWGHTGGTSHRDWTPRITADEGRAAMDIDWMTWAELTQAIPPAYTTFVGKQLMVALGRLG